MKTKFGLLLVLLLECNIISSAQSYGGWIITEPMLAKLRYHAGVRLHNGDILVTGGYGASGPASNNSEIFDATNLKWSAAASMNKGRGYHNLIKLNNGSIMAIGGYGEKTNEVLDSNYSQWSFTDTLKMSRLYGENTILMQNGNVLLIGGYIHTNNDTTGALKECEIYNYSKRIWEVTSGLNIGRFGQTATLLNDGRILVTGGNTINHGMVILNSCEIFDPSTEKWSVVAPMHYSRSGHSATLLPNGKVLVVGGRQAICELYDPLTDGWVETDKVMFAFGHNEAEILLGGKYLLLVQDVIDSAFNPGWELYSLDNLKSVYYGKFERLIYDPVIVKIDDKRVLFSGGNEFIESHSLFTASDLSQVYDLNITSVREDAISNSSKYDFSLNCYPNPFNGNIKVTFELSSSEYISLKVYNVVGEEITTIFKGELANGRHTFDCNLNNYASGVYLIIMDSSSGVKLVKIIHQK